MKAKQFLYIAILVAILAGAITIPVVAEDEIPMWVDSIRMSYRGRNAGPSAKLVGTVAVRDANKEPVVGATVGVEFTYADGRHWLAAGETSAQGTVSFIINSPDSGTYTLCVLGLGKEGWEYVPELNRETCDTYHVP